MHNFFVDPSIAKAKTLDTSFYTDPVIFEHCKEKIFARTWQFIGHVGLVKQKEAIHPFTLLKEYLNEPLVLTRDKEDKISLLSNVCTHRGNIIAENPCKQPHLRCRYHGRKFQLDGQFLSMPEFKEVENFPAAEDNLHKLPLFEWGNWLFTSLGQQTPPEIFLKDMMDRVSWMPLKDFVFEPGRTRSFQVNAHWALYCENYLEGFHIPFVHPGLNNIIDFGDYATELFFPYSNLQVGMAKSGEDCFDLPPDSPDYGKNIAAYYFWVFPNMMFNFYPWGLSVNVVEPVSISQSRVLFYSYVWDETKLSKGAGAELDKVEMEDEEIVEQVQVGIRSRFYKHGRYSVKREQGTHHFHRIISEFMNQ